MTVLSKIIKKMCRSLQFALLTIVACVAAGPTVAAPLSISQVPLFIANSVEPNIMLAIDDSGSMDSEVLFPTNDGALWWSTRIERFSGLDQNNQATNNDTFNFNKTGIAGGSWYKYFYLFPNNASRNAYDAINQHGHFGVPPLPAFAYARSPAFNSAYFNPEVRYEPWAHADGSPFPDANSTAAPNDPVLDANRTIDLTKPVACAGDANSAYSEHNEFVMMPGMALPAGTMYNNSGTTCVAATKDLTFKTPTTLSIQYFPATFWLPDGLALPDGYGFTGLPLDGAGPDGESMQGYEIKPENFSSSSAYQTAIQNFANWFTYYRKRHLALRAGIGQAFASVSDTRAGSFFINARNTVTMYDLDNASARDSFYSDIYHDSGSGGTPNREAVDHLGKQYRRTDTNAPITRACQRNFGVLFTDGYANATAPTNFGNVDGAGGNPFADDVFKDSVGDTLADIAAHYYASDLRPDLPSDRISVPHACETAHPDPQLDCQTNPHMGFFGVTLGQSGTLFGARDHQAETNDPYNNPPHWPTSFENRSPTAIDDLWHATINARGELLNAKTPKDVASQFSSALNTIQSSTGAAAAVTLSSTSLQGNTALYQATFSSGDWHGDLTAFNINSDGTLGSVKWNADEHIPGYSRRNVFTWSDAQQQAVPFDSADFTNLSTAQQQDLGTDDLIYAGNDLGSAGKLRITYLRGDQSLEKQNGGPFRNRGALLGDIVNSSPVLVDRQNFGFSALSGTEGDTYASFLNAKQTRTPIVYVGANDGMLHGFNTDTGAELLAYVPSAAYPALSRLSNPKYNHRYYVNGPSQTVDAYLGGRWRSVLASSTGAGGRDVFVLDVTDPASFSAANVLLDYNAESRHDDDLGFTLGQPTVVRMHNGHWALIFANGYNSPNQHAVLYIYDLDRASNNLIKIDTGVGSTEYPNGLSSPIPVDTDGDRITDAIYAGDLHGNLWKFDVMDNDPGGWDAAFSSGKGNNATPAPLFIARDEAGNPQPITVRPEVGRNRNGEIMIYFGTGSYFQSSDNVIDDAPPIQSFYGIIDSGAATSAPVMRSGLLEQVVLGVTTVTPVSGDPYDVRLTSKHVPQPANQGWYIDLPDAGERAVSNPVLDFGRIIFTTAIPNSNACEAGGSSWLMTLDSSSGARLDTTPYDVNNNGKFDGSDLVTVMLNGQPVKGAVSGIGYSAGIATTPGRVTAGEREHLYTGLSNGKIGHILATNPGAGGRLSWKQLQ